MPIRNKKTPIPKSPFSDDQVVVCITSFCSDEPFVGCLVQKGTRLKASSEIVKRHSYYFIDDGSPIPVDGALVRVEEHAAAGAYDPPPSVRYIADMSDDELVVCVEGFVVEQSGVDATGVHHGMIVVATGEKLPKDNDIVIRFPQRFRAATADS
jgi:hypothetical protein